MLRRLRILLGVTIVAIGALLAAYVLTRKGVPRGVANLMESADQFELLSVQTMYRGPDSDPNLILGRTAIADRATRDRLNAALADGVRDHDGSIAACFQPRHVIRLTRGDRVTELVICFECNQIWIYPDGKRSSILLVGRSPQPTFDAVLRAAGVPLAGDMSTTSPTTHKGEP